MEELEDGKILIEGFYYDIWTILEKRLNFSTSITASKVGQSDTIDYVRDKKFELLIGGNSLTKDRSKL